MPEGRKRKSVEKEKEGGRKISSLRKKIIIGIKAPHNYSGIVVEERSSV